MSLTGLKSSFHSVYYLALCITEHHIRGNFESIKFCKMSAVRDFKIIFLKNEAAMYLALIITQSFLKYAFENYCGFQKMKR